MVGNVEVGGVSLPLLGIIWLACLIIIIVEHFINPVSLGFIATIAWIVVLAGVVYFILWVLAQIFG